MTNQSSHTRRRRPSEAFTLVELLVVIAIIGILVALLIPAVMGAMRSARNGAISAEIANMGTAIQSFQTNYNSGFPADFSFEHRSVSTPEYNQIDEVNRKLERLFRTRVRANVPYANLDISRHDIPLNPFTEKFVRFEDLDCGEALVFWLMGFSNNSQRPLTGTWPQNNATARFPVLYLPKEEEVGQNYQNMLAKFYLPEKNPIFEFDVTRLADRDKDGFPEYYPPYGIQQPYIFYSSDSYATHYRNGVLTPQIYFNSVNEGNVQRVNVPRPYLANATPFRRQDQTMLIENKESFAEPTTFQIICSGLDGRLTSVPKNDSDRQWADGMGGKPSLYAFPEGPYPDEAQQDNITNFARGTLESQIP